MYNLITDGTGYRNYFIAYLSPELEVMLHKWYVHKQGPHNSFFSNCDYGTNISKPHLANSILDQM